jgi:hypothetical protein
MLQAAYQHTTKLSSQGCTKYDPGVGSSMHDIQSSPQLYPDILHNLKVRIEIQRGIKYRGCAQKFIDWLFVS